MKKWSINDINIIEKSPSSPYWMQSRFTDILFNSTNCRCKVESINPNTGEYRIVLQGTFDKEEYTPNDNY